MVFGPGFEENPDSQDAIRELSLQRMREVFLQHELKKQAMARALQENAQMAGGRSGVDVPTPPPLR